jgi:predicted Zn-dependent peptidase
MTLALLKTLHETGVTEAELQSVKAYLKGQFPPTIETSDRLASTIARLEFYGLDKSDIDDYYAKIDAVNLEVARRIVREHFPLENPVMVFVGKGSEIRQIASRYSPTLDVKSTADPGF